MTSPQQSSEPAIGGVFTTTVPVRWGDLDAQNHVNNAVYFRYLEEARIQLLQRTGLINTDKVPVLAYTDCNFLQPVLYPETLTVRLALTKVGRTSMQFDATIERNGDPGVVYARGTNVIVGADAQSGRPVPWTAQERAALASCLVNV